MKKLLIVLILLLLVSTSWAQSPNHLTGIVPIALFTNDGAGAAQSIITAIQTNLYEQSYGQLQVQFTVFPRKTNFSSSFPYYLLAKEEVNAHPGYYVYIFHDTGTAPGGYPWNGGTPWTDVQNPGVTLIPSLTIGYAGHELSHSLGLYHYHSLGCSEPYLSQERCNSIEYGGGYFSMQSHYPVGFKQQFGWLSPDQVVTVWEGEYTITPLETAGGVKTIRIPFNYFGSGDTYIYAYYRQNRGIILDLVSVEPHFAEGVAYESWNIDNLSLEQGEYTCFGSFEVAVTSRTTTSATVSLGPCRPPPPCFPLPAETRVISCSRPYRGTITQQRTSTCPGPTWGPWVAVSDTCVKKGKR